MSSPLACLFVRRAPQEAARCNHIWRRNLLDRATVSKNIVNLIGRAPFEAIWIIRSCSRSVRCGAMMERQRKEKQQKDVQHKRA